MAVEESEELLEHLSRSLYAILHMTCISNGVCVGLSFEDLYRDAYTLVILSHYFLITIFLFLGHTQTCGRTLQFDSTVNDYISARRGIN